jgi:hypothetical protein
MLRSGPVNAILYDDGAITVSDNEIRAKGFVLYVDTISSVSVTTVRPGKLLPLFLVVPIFLVVYLFHPLIGNPSKFLSMVFCPVLMTCAFLLLVFIARVSQLSLRTSGGPVLLASSISLMHPRETLERRSLIKEAIEKAA